jgi:hypothetical protein
MDRLPKTRYFNKRLARYCFILGFIIYILNPTYGQYRDGNKLSLIERNLVIDTLSRLSSIGVVENQVRNNKHKIIQRINKYNKLLDLYSPYCSSTIIYCFGVNKIKYKLATPRAYSWELVGKRVYYRSYLRNIGTNGIHAILCTLKKGDIVTFTWSHVEFFHHYDPLNRIIYTGGGNTKGGRAIDGIYCPIKRSINTIRGIMVL